MNKQLDQLISEDALTIREGLEGLAPLLPRLDEGQYAEAVEAVCGLFYADPMDHPELVPVLDRAEELLAEQGVSIIPLLLKLLDESDLKSHLRLISVMGRMGYAAVDPLLAAYADTADPYTRSFILYAMGKVRDPKVLTALPHLYQALDDDSSEVRDTATRTLGKICEHLNPDDLTEPVRLGLYENLMGKVKDPYAGVRSKALRSLGKMAGKGLLGEEQRKRLQQLLAEVLGETGGNWDVAYVVRAEAKKARARMAD